MGEQTDNVAMLKRADELACQLINTLKNEHECDLSTAFMVTAVMYGRLRFDAQVEGIDLASVDNLFMNHAQGITDAIDE